MPNDRDFFLVGVTGGIGSGKSAVCSCFEQLGRAVLSADAMARKIMDRDNAVKKAVRNLLGDSAYTPDGSLDRKYVATRAFGSPILRKRLNEVVHPAVFQEIDRRVGELPKKDRSPYVIIEAALIYESGLDKQLDYVIVVHAEEEARIKRVMERDHSSREEVLLRIGSQMPADTKARRADFVIRNDSETSQLLARVEFLDRLLTRMHVPQNPDGKTV